MVFGLQPVPCSVEPVEAHGVELTLVDAMACQPGHLGEHGTEGLQLLSDPGPGAVGPKSLHLVEVFVACTCGEEGHAGPARQLGQAHAEDVVGEILDEEPA